MAANRRQISNHQFLSGSIIKTLISSLFKTNILSDKLYLLDNHERRELVNKANTVNIGIIGYGYWGPKVAQNFFATKEVKIVSICDLHHSALEKVKLDKPNTRQ